MDSNNSYYLDQFNDSASFEFPQYPPIASTPCPLPKKPRQQQQQQQHQQSKADLNLRRPHYPDDVPGPINLDFSMHLGDASGISAYSKKLKRLYIVTNQALPIKFTWSPTSFQPLYLRSAILFADEHNKATPVQRCYAHRGPELPQNHGVAYDQLRHVFRASDPANACQSNYESDVNGILSTRTMLRAEDGAAWIDYHFFCQNSCPTGINRRPTKLVFLVEDVAGLVIAKRSVLVQICSNPRRDKARDDCRIPSNPKKPRTKKQPQYQSYLPPLPPGDRQNYTCGDDETIFHLDIDVLGEENYKAVLKYAYDVMAAQAIRTGNHQFLKPHMNALLAKLQLEH